MIDSGFFTKRIGRGIRLHLLSTPKFKTTLVKIFVSGNLGRNVSAVALTPFILRRGSRQFQTLREISRYLELLYGASLGVDILKLGEYQIWTFRLELVNNRYLCDEKLLRRGLLLLRDILFDPLRDKGGFLRDYVRQEKQNLKRFIEALVNDKPAYALERCCEHMFRDEPFGRYEYGRVRELEVLEPNGLYRMYSTVLERRPVDIFLVGEFDVTETAEELRKVFSVKRKGGYRLGKPVQREVPQAPREIVEEMDVRQARLVLGYRSKLSWRDGGFHKLIFLNALLGGYPHSRLFKHMREEKGLAYDVHSSVEKTKGLMFINCGIDAKRYREVLDVIGAQLRALGTGEITDNELEQTRRCILNSYRLMEDSPGQMIGYAFGRLLNGRRESYREAMEKIRAVTRDDICEAADWLRPDTFYLLRHGD
jgi:predicted Zn-dependent peptidase